MIKSCLSCKWYHGFRDGEHRCGHLQMCDYESDALSEYVVYQADPVSENRWNDCQMWSEYVHPADVVAVVLS